MTEEIGRTEGKYSWEHWRKSRVSPSGPIGEVKFYETNYCRRFKENDMTHPIVSVQDPWLNTYKNPQ